MSAINDVVGSLQTVRTESPHCIRVVVTATAKSLTNMWRRSHHKFGAQKTIVDGIVFDSKKESLRYKDLVLLQRSGEITGLQLQKEFAIVVNGYKICKYKCDFAYRDSKGDQITEDCKGFRTPEYILKRKLMKAVHNIDILET